MAAEPVTDVMSPSAFRLTLVKQMVVLGTIIVRLAIRKGPAPMHDT